MSGIIKNWKNASTWSYNTSAEAKNKSSVEAKKKEPTKFTAPGAAIKDVMPGKWYTPNGVSRLQYHVDKFVHRDKVVKYAAAFGIGGATVTGILIGVGVIKVAAVGAFFASPVGHGVLIGAGAAAGAFLLFKLGKFAYTKMKANAEKRMAAVAAAKQENFSQSIGSSGASASSSTGTPVPQYTGTVPPAGFVSPAAANGNEGSAPWVL